MARCPTCSTTSARRRSRTRWRSFKGRPGFTTKKGHTYKCGDAHGKGLGSYRYRSPLKLIKKGGRTSEEHTEEIKP